MRGIILLAAALAAVVLVSAADKSKSKTDFLDKAEFRYGMELPAARERINKDADDWNIIYQIDTPMTAEIACTFKNTELYLVRFYAGQCYFIERRAELALTEVQKVFDHYAGLYGVTPEATQSRDSRLLYARWMLKDRDIELTAHLRDGSAYILTYQEFDPLLLGEALHVREQELQSGENLEIDPLTGKPRLSTHLPAGEKSDDGGNASAEDDATENEQSEDDKEKDPPPEDDEDDDWY